MCEATTIGYAIAAISAVGAGVTANEQRRASKKQPPAPPAGPAPSATAYTTPEAEMDTGANLGRRRLKIDLNSSLPKTGAGIQVNPAYPDLRAAPSGTRLRV